MINGPTGVLKKRRELEDKQSSLEKELRGPYVSQTRREAILSQLTRIPGNIAKLLEKNNRNNRL